MSLPPASRVFRAVTAAEAVGAVKKALGPEAIVIRTSPVRDATGRTAIDVVAAPAPLKPKTARLVTPVAPIPTDLAAARTLSGELADIKQMVRQLLASDRAVSPQILSDGPLSGPLFACAARLSAAGLQPETVSRVIDAARRADPPIDQNDARAVRERILTALEGCAPAAVSAPRASRRLVVIAMLGGTGVGKSTACARLAASLFIHERRRVAIATADTRRPGAVEQMRVLAEAIGVPLHVLGNEQDASALRRDAQRDSTIIVDTPGIAPGDHDVIAELTTLMTALAPDERHFVAPASGAVAPVMRTLRALDAARCDRLVVTKLDEGEDAAALMFAVAAQLPISFVTQTQDVAERMFAAEPRALARRALFGADAGKSPVRP